MQSFIAIYGNVQLKRVYCSICKSWTFIVDNILTCCNRPYEEVPEKIKRISESDYRRKIPKRAIRLKILEFQGNRCIYCNNYFGKKYIKNNRLYVTKVEWDHFIPFFYSANNYEYNFVASCNICNSLKNSMMFQTLDEAKVYILNRRKEKSIRLL